MTSWDSSSLSFGSHSCIIQSALICTFIPKASLWPRCLRGTRRDQGLISAHGFRGLVSIMEDMEVRRYEGAPLHHGLPRSKGKACWTQKQLIPSKARPANLLPPTRLYPLKAPGNQHSKHKGFGDHADPNSISFTRETPRSSTHCILASLSKT